MMNQNDSTATVLELMLDFARLTGLEPASVHPRRYLWTDAFAVCNFLELFSWTDDGAYLDLALLLVDQVHHTLGRHREDDPRSGWISGLDETEGERHPTAGGLRIGKRLNERKIGEPYNDRLEWDQDGQYYHYLTKWMHALCRVACVTKDSTYLRWAIELAQTAHSGFTCSPSRGSWGVGEERAYGDRTYEDRMHGDRTFGKRMYWKMSIDLSRPLVPSMGQHDPLDGLVTYSELQSTAIRVLGESALSDLQREIADMADIYRTVGANLATDDPLGIGGLLFDACRIIQLTARGGFSHETLLESVVNSTLLGMEAFIGGNLLAYPAEYRLAFRELGLSIGLSGAEILLRGIESSTEPFSKERLYRPIQALAGYVPIRKTIEQFWMDGKNRETAAWTEHREINMVMLATSLAPGQFLTI